MERAEIVRKGKEVFDALLAALDDYSVDNRGDVGSWVREAALKAAEKWALRIAAVTTTQLITAEMSQVNWRPSLSFTHARTHAKLG